MGAHLQVCWISSNVSRDTWIPVSYPVTADLVFEVKRSMNPAEVIDEICSQRSITPPW